MTATVHLYVFDGFADWEPAFAIAGIRNPQFHAQPGEWDVKTVAARAGETLRSMGGVKVQPDLPLDALLPEASRLLILPGGPRWEDEHDTDHRAATELASAFLARGVPVAAICGATAGLARAGELDGRPHTSNAAAYLKGTGYAGGAHYVDEPVVRDRSLITAGGMAPIEFAREIFLELALYDDEVLADWFQLYKTGKPQWFARMAKAAERSDADDGLADRP